MNICNPVLPPFPVEMYANIITFLEGDSKCLVRLASVSDFFFKVVCRFSFAFRNLHCIFLLENRKWNILEAKKLKQNFAINAKITPGYLSCGAIGALNSILSVDKKGNVYQIGAAASQIDNSGNRNIFYISNASSPAGKEIIIPNDAVLQNRANTNKIISCHPYEDGFIIVTRDKCIVYRIDKNQNVQIELRKTFFEKNESNKNITHSVFFEKKLLLEQFDYNNQYVCAYYIIDPFLPHSKLKLLEVNDPENQVLNSTKYYSCLENYKIRNKVFRLLDNQLCMEYEIVQKFGDMCFKSTCLCVCSIQENNKENNIVKVGKLTSIDIDFFDDPPMMFGQWTVYMKRDRLVVLKGTEIWIPPTYLFLEKKKCTTYFVTADCLFLFQKNNFLVIYLPTKHDVTDSFVELQKYLDEKSILHSISLNFDFNKNKINVSALIFRDQKESKEGEIHRYKFNIHGLGFISDDQESIINSSSNVEDNSDASFGPYDSDSITSNKIKNSRELDEINRNTIPKSKYNHYKIACVVTAVFFILGSTLSVALIITQPGLILFKVKIITMTVPAMSVLSFTVGSTIATIILALHIRNFFLPDK